MESNCGIQRGQVRGGSMSELPTMLLLAMSHGICVTKRGREGEIHRLAEQNSRVRRGLLLGPSPR